MGESGSDRKDGRAEAVQEDRGIPGGLEIAPHVWELFWVIVFYLSIAVILLATFRVIGWHLSLVSIATVFLSILAVASSSRRLLIDENGLQLETTRFWLSWRKPLPREALRGLRVSESKRSLSWQGDVPPQRDLSYSVSVDLLTAKGRLRAFRSSLTAPPGRNREEALRVAEELSRLTGQEIERVFR